jgi:hypothetical protein
MMRALVLAAILLAGSSLPRAAAADANAVAVEISALVLPEENWNKTLSGITEQTRQYVEATIRQSGAAVPPEFTARFVEEFGKLYTYQEIRDLQAGLLVKHYTEGELRELLAFYKSPVGQKTIRVMPELMQDVNGQAMAVLQQRVPQVMERLRPLFENAKAPAAAAAPAARQPAKKPAR